MNYLMKSETENLDTIGTISTDEEIFEIEIQTKDDIIKILQDNVIKENSKSWKSYNLAKKIIFSDFMITPEIYEQQIEWIKDYLGM